MKVRIAFVCLLSFSTFFVKAENEKLYTQDSILLEKEDSTIISDSVTVEMKVIRKHVRAKAIMFTLLTGPLGGHRVYLRTRPGAPIIYALTLGGFGILPLVDLAHLIFKKDISSFEKNSKIMMWSK